MKNKIKARVTPALTLSDREIGDIKLWFGWGTILGYPTGPKDYLREALKPERRAEFLAMPRALRKLILRFIINESARRMIEETK